MKTDCAALRQSKTNPATAGSTTNTIASDDDENNDHDDGDSAKWACGRLRSCKLSQPLCHGPVAGYDLDIVPPPESTELRKLGSRQTSTAARDYTRSSDHSPTGQRKLTPTSNSHAMRGCHA